MRLKRVSKYTFVLMAFAIALLLGACSDDKEPTDKTKEPVASTEQKSAEASEKNAESASDTPADETDKVLPMPKAFEDMKAPTISLLDKDGKVKLVSFDHSYAEVCWMDCSSDDSYKYTNVHAGQASIGETMNIDWSMMNPKPAEVNFVRLDVSDDKNLKEISRVKLAEGSHTMSLPVNDTSSVNPYVIEFVWKDETKTVGRSMLNFKIE